MKTYIFLIFSMLYLGIYGQNTESKNKFSLSVSGGYQFNSDFKIFTVLQPLDDFEYESSDFFGGVSANYSLNHFDISAGFQSAYQDINSETKRTTLYTRILEIRGLWKTPISERIKLGGALQKKIQELKVFTNQITSPFAEVFIGVYAYSAYYFSPTLAYKIPVNDKISVQITAQQAIPLNEVSWTNFQGDTLNQTKESQTTTRVFFELFYKL